MANEVENLLNDKKVYFRVSGNDYVIHCPNPEHEDTNPSFRVDKIKGIGHCFSCGYKYNIFKHYGVIANTVNIRIAGLKEKLRDLKASANGISMLTNPVAFTRVYRNISAETYIKFGAFSTDSVKEMEDRLIFPLKDISGTLRGFVGRHMLSAGNPRYLNYPANVKMQMFPPRLDGSSRYLVLVEGLFDMLNLYDSGLTAVSAIMGTQTLKAEDIHLKMLPFKAQGVTHIFLALDGDEAGAKAGFFLKPLLEKLDYVVEIIPLEAGTDPGGFDHEEIEALQQYCEEKSLIQQHE